VTAPSPAIPVVVIGGYLGAGKTTLVNHLLRTGTGLRTLVLVNDFGAVAVDAELIEADEGEVLTLVNGCVCCSLSSPLAETFETIRAMRPPPELVVLETSGVADPAPVAHHAMTPGFRLDGVVVVADAATVRRRAADELVGRTVLRQLAAADLVVVNRADLATPAQLAGLGSWLDEVAPGTDRVLTEHGRVPPEAVIGAGGGAPALSTEALPVHDRWIWNPGRPVDRGELEAVLDALPSSVVRVKGIVALTDEPTRRTVVQRVGRWRTMTPGRPWEVGEAPRSSLVVLGLPGSVDPQNLGRMFDPAAAAPTPTPGGGPRNGDRQPPRPRGSGPLPVWECAPWDSNPEPAD
jgi:G3E family GTPase